MVAGFNGLCHKEYSKPPVGKKEREKKLQERRSAAEAKAARSAKAEEEEKAEANAEAERDPAEPKAELGLAQEADKKKSEVKRLQNAQRKAAKACSSNEWVDALTLYTECIGIDSNDYILWSNRAAVQNKLGRYDEMLEDATRCVELNPEFAKGWARIGIASTALENYDGAVAAFQRALALEPESLASQEGLAAALRAQEEDAQEDAFDALLKELKQLTAAELRERAYESGILEERVHEAESKTDLKNALISLIVAHEYIANLVREDLADLDLESLRARAAEEGLDDKSVAAVQGCEDPFRVLAELVVKFVSNDLIGVAIEVLAEAEFEEVSSDDDEGIDIEVVALDNGVELELSAHDVFLEGAYIDEMYGELVLPNGTRLGHRSMYKYYKQRLQTQDEKQLVISSARHKTMSLHSRVQEKIAFQNRMKVEHGIADMASKSKRTMLTSIKRTELHNMKLWHNLHMWGAGGGGSHYWCAGSKQYNKGNKVKGVVLRHSRQGAKLQAARNKSNRGNASVAVLR